MYGLASRESLAKRQSRWIRDTAEILRENPAQNALNKEENTHKEKPGIISLMNSQLADTGSYGKDNVFHKNKPFNNHMMDIISVDESDEFKALESLCQELKDKYSYLERECKSIRKILQHDNGNISQGNNASELSKFIQESTQRFQKIEQSLIHLTKEIETIKSKSQQITVINSEQLIDFEPTKQEYVPFVHNEECVGRDNICTLKEGIMDMVVEIIGLYSEGSIIYPFGLAKNLPEYSELTIIMTFEDGDGSNGSAYGEFKRRPDGVYVIQPTEFYINGNLTMLDACTLPLTLRCNVDLNSN
jgi:hypothetical protein